MDLSFATDKVAFSKAVEGLRRDKCEINETTIRERYSAIVGVISREPEVEEEVVAPVTAPKRRSKKSK